MELHPTIDSFYRSILNYAGLMVLDDGSIVTCSSDAKPIKSSKSGKHYYLPFLSQTKSPEGKVFFHPLREKHAVPESEAFNIFRNNLTMMLNLKFAALCDLLIDVGNNGPLQKKVRSSVLEEVLGNMGEMDDSFSGIVSNKILNKAMDEYGFAPFIDFDIERDGKVDGVAYTAVGKVIFNIRQELDYSLGQSGTYTFYGVKVRKKDIVMLDKLVNAIIPGNDVPETWVETTENRVFSYLNVLLKTSYLVASRIDALAALLTKDLKIMEESEVLRLDLDWVGLLPELYEMTTEISIIGNLEDMKTEAAIKRIAIDEGSSVNEPPPEVAVAPAHTGASPVSFAPPKTTVAVPTHDAPTFVPTTNNAEMGSPQPQQNLVNQQQALPAPIVDPAAQQAAMMGATMFTPPQQQNTAGVPMLQQQLNSSIMSPMFAGVNPGVMNPAIQQQLMQNPMVQQQMMFMNPMQQQQYLMQLQTGMMGQMGMGAGPITLQQMLSNPALANQLALQQQAQMQNQQQQATMMNLNMMNGGMNQHEQDKIRRLMEGKMPGPGAKIAPNPMLEQFNQMQNQNNFMVPQVAGIPSWIMKSEMERMKAERGA